MPDQARVKIYGSNNIALNTDPAGNLGITTLDGQALSITLAANAALAMTTLSGQALAITLGTDQALAMTTLSGQALAITLGANQALAMTTLSGQALAITLGIGEALAITVSSPLPVTSTLATADTVYATGDFITTDDALTTPVQNVLALSDWSWIAYNTATSAGALAMVKMQGSPDGTVWLDNSTFVSVTQNALAIMTPTYFLKYSRVYYSGAGSSNASLNIYFQGQG